MSCNSPLKAYARFDPDRKKKELRFSTSHDLPFIDYEGKIYSEKMLIPCGQCIGCRLEYSRQWALRCMLEALSCNMKDCYFLTLTYSDEFLPKEVNYCIDTETGEAVEFESNPLVPDHLKKFLKDLREDYRRKDGITNIRFFGCGEYGDKTERAHYHLIMFNLPLDDLELKWHNERGEAFYNSKRLTDIWKKGFVAVSDVTFDTCAYVARYMLKKHKGRDRDYYEKNGLYPDFSRCSRRPGIGKTYFDKNSGRIYEFDEITITGSGGRPLQAHPPKYYDRLYDHIDPDRLLELKEKRKEVAENNFEKVMQRTSLSPDEYFELKEKNAGARLKRLPRHSGFIHNK